MKKDGLLNPQILSGIPVIDISLIRGIPDFGVVLCSVIDEMVVESFIVAEEMADKSQDTYGTVIEALPQVPFRCIAHEEFKEMAAKAKAVIRTGETTPYANIILVAGVNF